MRQTLFFLPGELAGLTLFGWGWMLIAWGLFAVWVLIRRPRHQPDDRWSMLPMLVLVAAAIVFVLPRIEEPIPPGFLTIPPVTAEYGLPIRGYGVMMLLAVLAGVGLATHRAQRAGLEPETIWSLAFFMVIGGIIGARLFFIIQYWSYVRADSLLETLGNMVSFVKGGLVVYGSLIGAAAAFVLHCRLHRLPILPLGDLIAPSLPLGLAIGRLGCLLNGCCFGDVCQHDYPWMVTFPQDSPPYVYQMGNGTLYGFRLVERDGKLTIATIDPDGPMSSHMEHVGATVKAINGTAVADLEQAQLVLEQTADQLSIELSQGTILRLSLPERPARSRPIHPTQIYSSINAGLICLLALAFFPYRRRHGQVLALVLTVYAATRFLLEVIRTDEGEFMADLTISQNVSLLVAVGMIGLWWYILRQPRMDGPIGSK